MPSFDRPDQAAGLDAGDVRPVDRIAGRGGQVDRLAPGIAAGDDDLRQAVGPADPDLGRRDLEPYDRRVRRAGEPRQHGQRQEAASHRVASADRAFATSIRRMS